ncbi:MAG: peroxiredoxin [Bacteroidota bacterium]
MARLKVGEVAPSFTLQNQRNESISLAQYQGRPLVVYFYPADDTPGCTAEACGFRDQYEDFVSAGAEVIGISRDSVETHAKFANGRKLPFQLLADPGAKVTKAYGVSGGLMGLIPGRETFVIDPEGKIAHHFSSQFQIGKHIDEALTVIQSLQKVDN